MKKFKKVIPALCMLLVSAIMLGSTTYAWFSMNNKVTASGMTVGATTNTQFLVISTTQALGTLTELSTSSEGSGKLSPTNNNTTNKVFPSAKAASKIQSGETTINAGEWYTANSTKYDQVGSGETLTNVKKVNEGDANYHIKYEFYVGLAEGSTDFSGKLSISIGNSDLASTATKAYVSVGNANAQHLYKASGDTGSSTTAEFTDIKLDTDSSTERVSNCVKVTVILYVDGTDAAVKSAGYSEITGNLNLTITAT